MSFMKHQDFFFKLARTNNNEHGVYDPEGERHVPWVLTVRNDSPKRFIRDDEDVVAIDHVSYFAAMGPSCLTPAGALSSLIHQLDSYLKAFYQFQEAYGYMDRVGFFVDTSAKDISNKLVCEFIKHYAPQRTHFAVDELGKLDTYRHNIHWLQRFVNSWEAETWESYRVVLKDGKSEECKVSRSSFFHSAQDLLRWLQSIPLSALESSEKTVA